MAKREVKVTDAIFNSGSVPKLVEDLTYTKIESIFTKGDTDYIVSDKTAVDYALKNLSFWDKLNPRKVAHAGINAYEAMLVGITELTKE